MSSPPAKPLISLASDALYRSFFHGFADEIYLHDDQGFIIDINHAACSNMGYSREEMIDKNVTEFSTNYSREQLLQLWRSFPVGQHNIASNCHRRKDGSTYHLEVHLSCQEIEGRKCFLAVARRTDEKRQRQIEILQLNARLEALVEERTRLWRESSRLLDALMEQMPDAIFIKDLQGRYIYANNALAHQLQMSLQDILGKTDAQLYPPEQLQLFAHTDREVLERHKPCVYEDRLQTTTGWVFTNCMKTVYRDESGKIIGILGIMRDVSDVRNAQQQMDHQYEMLRQAEHIAKIGSWTLNLATNTFTASEMLTEMNGLKPEDPPLTPQTLASMLPPDQHAILSAAIGECIQKGTPYTVDVEHKRPEGGTFPARIRGCAYRDEHGKIVMLHGTLQDLSDLMEADQRLQTLADNLPNGAIFRCEQTADGKLFLRYVSAGIQRLLGISANTFVSQQTTFTGQIHDDDKPRFFAAVMHSLKTCTAFDLVTRVYNAERQWRWMRARAAPRRTHDGMLWEGILLDVTPEYETQASLQQAKEAAEAAERAKSEFLATMSHEIRTPMNTVIGMAQLLQQTPLSPKQRNYLDKATLSANALLKLINEILDFSKLEAEMLHIDPVPFHLDALLESVHAVTGLPAEQKGLEIIYLVAPSVPRHLIGDLQRLGQVLTNLVGNAIKFTDRGEVMISMDAVPDPQAADHILLTVSVRDTGIGIHPEHLARLFDPFMQAEAHISRRFGGTGLGLAICHKLVHLMGGSIQVQSQLGQGSEFSFTVQLQSQAKGSQKKSFAQQQHKVLVVDDNTVAREALRDMVQGFGLLCETASSGLEALDQLQSASQAMQPFQLVLMDWQMPGMDGLEAAQHIRESSELSHLPAMLMVTAHCRDEVIDRVAALQLQGLLLKPVTESMLFNALQEALRPSLYSAEGTVRSMLQQPGIHIPAALRGRCVLVVDDNRMNREVAQELLELAHIRVTTASSGREALALLETIPFDAVLLDVQMPEMDGMAVARHIRLKPQWQNLPVWALTAQARTEDKQAILDSGMDGQLTKPINAQLLFQTLEQALRNRPPVQVDAHHYSPAPPPQASGISKHLGGQQDRIQRLLRAFIRDFADTPQQLHTLYEAQNWKALGMLAHTLKGAIGYLEQPHTMQAMAALESACQRQQVALTDVQSASQQLVQALAYIDHCLLSPSPPTTGPAATAMETQALIACLNQALPAIQRGDYAGIRSLEQVENALRGTPMHALAARALALTEDLETEAASQCLQQLLQTLADGTHS